jgi:uncharacterized protein YcbK (DUF882 family)
MTNKTRRALLTSIGYTAAVFALPAPVIGAVHAPRQLSLYHTHTRTELDIVYYDGDGYVPEALDRINLYLRDFRTRDTHPIDPGLLDILFETQTAIGTNQRFEVISCYRSPATNEMLRRNTDGVAKTSLHMQGRAIDVRLTDVRTGRLHRAALDLGRGGVGYYPQSDFIHLDTGNPRSW